MHINQTLSLLFTLTAAPGLLHAGSMETGSIEHAAPFFAERLPLGIDGEKLGVFIDGLDAPAAAAILVDDLGVEETDIQPSTVPGWFYIDVSSSAFFVDRPLLDCLDDLLRLDRFDMVSPVYLAGDMGLPWMPTRDVIIALDPDLDRADASRLADALVPGTIIDVEPGGLPNTYIIQTPYSSAIDVIDLVNRLSGIGPVVYAQPDAITIHRHFLIPNDPLFPQQWALNQSNNVDMNGPEAWDVTIGSEDVAVVILDDGAQQNHPDLHQLPGSTFTGSSSAGEHSTPCDGHGTAVSSCVSSTINNNTDLVGIAPGCHTRAGKIFNAIDFFGFCLGFLEFQDSWGVNGISWSASVGARVTNSSWGGGSPSAAIESAYQSTYNQGVMHFGAAGNDGSSNISWPASSQWVHAISAMASNGSLASFSTYGSGLFASAPGASILTADRTGGDGFGSGDTVTIDGTSFASPYAAGVAALVFSRNNTLSPADVKTILEQNSTDYGSSGYDTLYGWGMVNAEDAVLAVDVEPDCPGDIDGSGNVGVDDLLLVINQWGSCSSCIADINGDGQVGVDDLLFIISDWGSC